MTKVRINAIDKQGYWTAAEKVTGNFEAMSFITSWIKKHPSLKMINAKMWDFEKVTVDGISFEITSNEKTIKLS